MVAGLRLCSGVDAVKKFERSGWTVARQKGSHVMMVKSGFQYTLSIPLHKELGPGIFRKLVKQAGLTMGEFNDL